MTEQTIINALAAHRLRCADTKRFADKGMREEEHERNVQRAYRFGLLLRDRYGWPKTWELTRAGDKLAERAQKAQAARLKRTERKASRQAGGFR